MVSMINDSAATIITLAVVREKRCDVALDPGAEQEFVDSQPGNDLDWMPEIHNGWITQSVARSRQSTQPRTLSG